MGDGEHEDDLALQDEDNAVGKTTEREKELEDLRDKMISSGVEAAFVQELFGLMLKRRRDLFAQDRRLPPTPARST